METKNSPAKPESYVPTILDTTLPVSTSTDSSIDNYINSLVDMRIENEGDRDIDAITLDTQIIVDVTNDTDTSASSRSQ